MIANRALLIQTDRRETTRIIKKVTDQPPLAPAYANTLSGLTMSTGAAGSSDSICVFDVG